MRWFVPALAMHPLSMQQCCVRNPLNDVALVLPAGECAVLAECAGCRTLEEHAAGAMLALDAPSAHHPDIDMTQKGITIATYSTREDGEPSRGEIAGAFGAVLFVVGLFWLAANALGF